MQEQLVRIKTGGECLEGSLALPSGARGLVLFAHGSGSSRHSPRNRYVAEALQQAGLGTLLIDLLTRAEEQAEAATRHLRFDIGLLSERLVATAAWLHEEPATRSLPLGYFGASTGAAAALVAAALQPEQVAAVVSRGGRPDLAAERLSQVQAPTLLIVGSHDGPVIPLNEQALSQLRCAAELVLVPGATHLFEEPGALEEVARLAAGWFVRYLSPSAGAPAISDDVDLSVGLR